MSGIFSGYLSLADRNESAPQGKSKRPWSTPVLILSTVRQSEGVTLVLVSEPFVDYRGYHGSIPAGGS